jgi:hypothetical protein
MAYSRFQIGGGINEFETVDFFANLPVTVRHDDVSFKGTLYHESSHLGDDYIRETGSTGFRSSNEGVRLQGAYEPKRYARVYGGANYLIHTVPVVGPWSGQAGLEFFTDDLTKTKRGRTRLFLAQDFQSHPVARGPLPSRLLRRPLPFRPVLHAPGALRRRRHRLRALAFVHPANKMYLEA